MSDCGRTQEAWLEGGDDEALAAANAHARGCGACRATRSALEHAQQAVRSVDANLPDLTRARMAAHIAEALDAEPPRAFGARRIRLRWTWLASLGVTAAAAMAVGLLLRPFETPPVAKDGAAERTVVAEGPRVLTPVSAEMTSAQAPRVRGLRATKGERTRARLDDRARLSLLARSEDARLDVVMATDEIVVIRLERGTLVADWSHHRGGTLRIEAPGATVDVVGTLFQVSAESGQSRVSVARGVVSVRGVAADTRLVNAGRSWTSAAPSLGEVSSDETTRFEEHEAAAWDVASAAAAAPAVGAPVAHEAAPAAVSPAAAAPVAHQTARPRMLALREAVAPPAEPRALVPRAPDVAPTADVPATPAIAPAPAVTPPPVQAAVVLPETPGLLYGRAESALRRGDVAAARTNLERMIALYPGEALADEGRLELARLLARAGEPEAARVHLTTLAHGGRDKTLVESARLGLCRLAFETRSGTADEARACLMQFRASEPSPVHDAAALALLIAHAPPASACVSARAQAEEYVSKYPNGPYATQARALVERCGGP